MRQPSRPRLHFLPLGRFGPLAAAIVVLASFSAGGCLERREACHLLLSEPPLLLAGCWGKMPKNRCPRVTRIYRLTFSFVPALHVVLWLVMTRTVSALWDRRLIQRGC